MPAKTLSRTDVINETVEYYKSNPRAKNGTGCVYVTKEGDMCAVGRCLKTEYKTYEWSNAHDSDIYGLCDHGPYESDIYTLQSLLNDEYSHITDIQFWGDLQSLHDHDGYWISIKDSPADNMLTPKGRDFVEELLAKYAGVDNDESID